jgi:2-oxoglutarate ferredoxin oxidoreductase subunit delta
MATRGAVLIDRERCKGCELCVHACPQGVLRMSEGYNAKGYHPVMLDESEKVCTGCAVCAVICPDVVFTVYRLPVRHKARSRRAALAA